MAASNPPADPPMPTIGQCKFLLADFDLDFDWWAFDCEDFVLLLFACERSARLFAVRFAAIMALCMLVPSRASYKAPFTNRFSGFLRRTEKPLKRFGQVISASHPAEAEC
jgi:hypothetical protein